MRHLTPARFAFTTASLLGAALLVAAHAPEARAAALTYDANTGTAGAQDGAGAGWNTANTNWWNGADVAWPDTNADEAILGAGSGAADTVTVGTVTANKITFNAPGSGNYTLSGGTITLAGTTPTITANANASATINSVLAGTDVTVNSSRLTGLVTLGGANTFTGTLYVNNGAGTDSWDVPNVQLSSTGSLAASSVVIGSGGAAINTPAIFANNAANQMTSAVVSLNASSGAGSYAIWELRGNNQSIVGLQTTGATGSQSIVENSNNSSSYLSDSVLTITGGGTYTYNGLIRNRSTGASGTLGITMAGTGTQILSGNNTFTGDVNVDAGILTSAAASAAGYSFLGGPGTSGSHRVVNIASGAEIRYTSGTANSFLNLGGAPASGGYGAFYDFNISGTLAINDGGGTSQILDSTFNLNNGGVITNTGTANNGAYGLLFGWTSGGSGNINATGTGNQITADRIGFHNGATITTNVGADLSITSVIGGSSANGAQNQALIKAGAGLLILTGANTYTGSTTINGGTLEIGGAGVLGAGAYAGAIGNAGTLLVSTSANQTFSGAITGAGNLVKSGAGTLTLSSTANAYTGTTTIDGGRLNVTGNLTSAITVNAGGAISGSGNGVTTGVTTGSLTTNAGAFITLTGGATTTSLTANGVDFAGTTNVLFATALTNATVYDVVTYGGGGLANYGNLNTAAYRGAFTDTGTKITMTADVGTRTWNTTSGTWAVNTGTSFAEGDQKFFYGDTVVFGNIGSNSAITLVGDLAPGAVTVSNAANTYTFSGGAIIGGGSLTKSGAGTLVLTSANTYTGGTNINGGTLALSGGNNRLASTGTVNFGGNATLDLGGTSQTLATLTLGNSVTGSITSTGGTGTLATTGAVTVGSPDNNMAARTLNLTQVNFNPAGTLTVGRAVSGLSGTANGTLNVNQGSLTAQQLLIGYVRYNGGAFAPAVNGTVNLNGTVATVRTINLTDADHYNTTMNATATLTLNSGSILAVQTIQQGGGNGNPRRHININWNDGTIKNYDANTDLTISAMPNMTSGGLNLLGTGLHAFDISSGRTGTVNLAMSGVGSLTKLGAGTLTLSGAAANTYTGLTTVSDGTLALNKTAGVTAIAGDNDTGTTDILINGGTLRLLANEQIADDATIEMSSGTFDLNGRTETISRFVNNGGTFSTGAGQLIGTGASVVWNSGTNTVNDGGLVADRHIQISGGTNTVEGGATGGVLRLDAPGAAPNGFEMSGGSTLTLNSDNAVAGKLLLRGDVSVTDATTNTIANGGVAANSGNVDLDGGTRTFTIADAGGALNIGADVVSGIAGGALTKEGDGTLALSGANTYTGATAVNDGTLLVNGTHAAGAGAYTVGAGGRLGGSGSITTASLTVAGQITGGDFGTVDTLAISAPTVNLSGTYLFDVDYSGMDGDLISITDAASLDLSGSTFEINELNPGDMPAAGSHYYIKIFESNVANGGAAPNFVLSAEGLARGQSVVTWDGGKTYYLVPEPASFALLAMGSLLLLRRPSSRSSRRRGRQVQA